MLYLKYGDMMCVDLFSDADAESMMCRYNSVSSSLSVHVFMQTSELILSTEVLNFFSKSAVSSFFICLFLVVEKTSKTCCTVGRGVFMRRESWIKNLINDERSICWYMKVLYETLAFLRMLMQMNEYLHVVEYEYKALETFSRAYSWDDF